jgi:hypothetical protein
MRAHEDTCVVFCVDREPDDAGDHPFHACWCRDGGLSYDDFKGRHPEWALRDSWDWLHTQQGREWRRAMEAHEDELHALRASVAWNTEQRAIQFREIERLQKERGQQAREWAKVRDENERLRAALKVAQDTYAAENDRNTELRAANEQIAEEREAWKARANADATHAAESANKLDRWRLENGKLRAENERLRTELHRVSESRAAICSPRNRPPCSISCASTAS